MVGLLFYNSEEDSMMALIDLSLKYKDPFELDNIAYPALFIASQYGSVQDQEARNKAFNFCYSTTYDLNCSILMFNFFDVYSFTVSESYYQVPYGSCNDSFTIPRSYW